MAREYDHLFKLLIIGDSGKMADAKQRMRERHYCGQRRGHYCQASCEASNEGDLGAVNCSQKERGSWENMQS